VSRTDREALPPGDDPDGVHEARDVPEKGEEEVNPELSADAFLQEDAERRYDDGQQNSKEVGGTGGAHGWDVVDGKSVDI
jgi:hypothetical protein